jgi:death-on-curing protein
MSLDNIVTLTVEAVITIHDEVLNESGGLPGISPDKSLDGALHRVINHALYQGVSDIHEVAALYGIAIARGHAFNDANKRTAFVSMATFLDLNGFDLAVPPGEIADTMVDVAEGKMNLPDLARWLRTGSHGKA